AAPTLPGSWCRGVPRPCKSELLPTATSKYLLRFRGFFRRRRRLDVAANRGENLLGGLAADAGDLRELPGGGGSERLDRVEAGVHQLAHRLLADARHRI